MDSNCPLRIRRMVHAVTYRIPLSCSFESRIQIPFLKKVKSLRKCPGIVMATTILSPPGPPRTRRRRRHEYQHEHNLEWHRQRGKCMQTRMQHFSPYVMITSLDSESGVDCISMLLKYASAVNMYVLIDNIQIRQVGRQLIGQDWMKPEHLRSWMRAEVVVDETSRYEAKPQHLKGTLMVVVIQNWFAKPGLPNQCKTLVWRFMGGDRVGMVLNELREASRRVLGMRCATFFAAQAMLCFQKFWHQPETVANRVEQVFPVKIYARGPNYFTGGGLQVGDFPERNLYIVGLNSSCIQYAHRMLNVLLQGEVAALKFPRTGASLGEQRRQMRRLAACMPSDLSCPALSSTSFCDGVFFEIIKFSRMENLSNSCVLIQAFDEECAVYGQPDAAISIFNRWSHRLSCDN